MKILIADPHPEVQDALRLIAGRIPGVTAVSAAGSLVQLLAQCAQDCPDLVLFDLGLVQPTRAHPQALAGVIAVLRRLCPAGRVVAMSSHLDAKQEALSAGASAFISKTDPPDEVLTALARILLISVNVNHGDTEDTEKKTKKPNPKDTKVTKEN